MDRNSTVRSYAFKAGQEQIRKAAQKQERELQSIGFPVLLFPEVSEKDLGADRQSMNGSIEQIAEDIQGFEKLGVNHVNLVFDFGTYSQDLKKRLGYAKQIRDAVIQSVFTRM